MNTHKSLIRKAMVLFTLIFVFALRSISIYGAIDDTRLFSDFFNVKLPAGYNTAPPGYHTGTDSLGNLTYSYPRTVFDMTNMPDNIKDSFARRLYISTGNCEFLKISSGDEDYVALQMTNSAAKTSYSDNSFRFLEVQDGFELSGIIDIQFRLRVHKGTYGISLAGLPLWHGIDSVNDKCNCVVCTGGDIFDANIGCGHDLLLKGYIAHTDIPYQEDEWQKFRLCYDVDNGIWNIYLNDRLVIEDVPSIDTGDLASKNNIDTLFLGVMQDGLGDTLSGFELDDLSITRKTYLPEITEIKYDNTQIIEKNGKLPSKARTLSIYFDNARYDDVTSDDTILAINGKTYDTSSAVYSKTDKSLCVNLPKDAIRSGDKIFFGVKGSAEIGGLTSDKTVGIELTVYDEGICVKDLSIDGINATVNVYNPHSTAVSGILVVAGYNDNGDELISYSYQRYTADKLYDNIFQVELSAKGADSYKVMLWDEHSLKPMAKAFYK